MANRQIMARLRDWDRCTAKGVSHFIAISETVRRRIRDCYERSALSIPGRHRFLLPLR